MNEETATPETLADIIAEMRRFAAFAAGRSRITPAPSLAAEQEGHAAQLAKYADRIEAAAERERAPGNAAGQRDAAIDERDRLRDIVRRLTEYADAVNGYRPLILEVVSSEHPAWTFDGAALLREARAALGAGETPTGKGVGR